ncbi:hypothetical protein [Fibrobacter sp.]|uniref:hypothetical protein n=1 Tax=Fibrobacter sp. TaxID=35828 RepID=UPI00389031AA
MAEEIEVTEKTTVEIQTFTNDIDDALKERIRETAAKRIEELLEKPVLTRGDLVHLAGVAHGSIKSRAEKFSSAAELITAVLDGVRASGTRQPSVESVKSFLDSLSPEDKAKFLAQIGA